MDDSAPTYMGIDQSRLDLVPYEAAGLGVLVAIDDEDRLADLARRLAEGACAADVRTAREIDTLRDAIQGGDDPLGAAFLRLRSAETRRSLGAVYTPPQIVEAMTEWAAAESGSPPVRVVDPGAGSGRFLMAAAKAFPNTPLVAVEIDPLAVLVLRANAAAAGFADRLTIHETDYRLATLAPVAGKTLFLGNPPYVRHHGISAEAKDWFAATARKYGLKASKLAGLHIHFFLRTMELARPGDLGAFITSSEWLDVGYGSVLRQLLAADLGGTALHSIDPASNPFGDTMTTSTIACFQVGARPKSVNVRAVTSLDTVKPLSVGKLIPWPTAAGTERWSSLFRPVRRHAAGTAELGELFRVHRGQVTGCNAIWIAGPEAHGLPARFLFPAVTRAAELFAAGEVLRKSDHLRRIVDLPIDLDVLPDDERRSIAAFLDWARRNGAHEAYVARNRTAWWSVGLREPAPMLCTYMARQPPAFVRNVAGAYNINISHGLYPREPMDDTTVGRIVRYLRRTVGTAEGRTYAGGLVKYEPGEISRLRIPIVLDMPEQAAA